MLIKNKTINYFTDTNLIKSKKAKKRIFAAEHIITC